jgi:hypothetical protein
MISSQDSTGAGADRLLAVTTAVNGTPACGSRRLPPSARGHGFPLLLGLFPRFGLLFLLCGRLSRLL